MKAKQLPVYILIFLALASCKKGEMVTNPLLTEFSTPYNTIPFDRLESNHFVPAFDTAFIIAREEINQIITNTEAPDFSNTVEALEKSGELLNLVTRILFNLNSAETDSNIQAIARDISPRLSDFSNDITLNEILFTRVKDVFNNTDKNTLSSEQRILLEKTYKMFVRSGANLSGEQKEQYRALTKELSELNVKFGENLLASTNAYILHITDSSDLSGLPESIITAAKEDASARESEGWIFSLQYPSYGPFMQYSTNRELRKQMYIAYNTRALKNNESDNREIAKRIASLRMQIANLIGYPTYADFALEEKMAKTPQRVIGFLNELLTASMPYAQKELDEVTAFAKSIGDDIRIEPWDWSYYSEKLKKQKFDINDEETRPYFTLESVQKGVFDLAGKLYDLSFSENKEIQVYHPDVKAFEVYDEDSKFLAILYLDFFPREGKRPGAWMTEFKPQKMVNGEDYRPHISLVLNFSKPSADKPSLLTYNEVRTLLHEFGHGLHGMLSKVTYSSLSGTSVYQDFVELPSMIMENWAEEKEWLDMIAIHYETEEKMPEAMLQKIIDSKNFNSGYASVRQISFGLNDMSWHTLTEPYEGDVVTFENRAMAPTRLLPLVEGTCMSTAFSHIFSGGYAAGYYGYKWAEVLDADAYYLFKENGIFDKATATSFRDNILSKGGTEPPMELYVLFRGHEPSIEPLLERSGFIKVE